jgi:hypothetical protein
MNTSVTKLIIEEAIGQAFLTITSQDAHGSSNIADISFPMKGRVKR